MMNGDAVGHDILDFYARELVNCGKGHDQSRGAPRLKPMHHLSGDLSVLPVMHRRDYCSGPVSSAAGRALI